MRSPDPCPVCWSMNCTCTPIPDNPSDASYPSNPSDTSHPGRVDPDALPVSASPSDTSDALDASDASPGTGDLLDDLEAWYRTFTYTRNDHAYYVLALWTAHTHVIEQVSTTPRLAVASPVPGCGKTTVLEHLEHLTPAPLLGSHATPALLVRVIAAQQTTVLLDETDNLLNAKREGVGDLVATLNSGYRRGASRPTLTKSKDGQWEPEKLPTYAAVALAGIGDHLPAPLLDRCIVIDLDRALPGTIADSDWDDIEPEAGHLREHLAAWAELEGLTVARPAPGDLHGRKREIWMPLLHVAAQAGTEHLARAREAVASFEGDRQAAAELKPRTQKEQLLTDLETMYRETGEPSGFVKTTEILAFLAVESPDVFGPEARYGELKPKRLANLLAQYGVRPDRDAHRTARGYQWAAIRHALDHYNPNPERNTE